MIKRIVPFAELLIGDWFRWPDDIGPQFAYQKTDVNWAILDGDIGILVYPHALVEPKDQEAS